MRKHLFLLDAFKDLAGEFDKIKLILVGQGFQDDPENTEKEIRAFVKTNRLSNKVVLIGYRNDIPR